MSELTILYGPVTVRYQVKNLIRQKILKRSYYGGHATLTESLLKGFEKIGYDKYNYQPVSGKDVFARVHVLAGIDTLSYAIKLKRSGKIDYLSVGPNIDFDGTERLMSDPAIDFCIKHSQWEIDEQIKRTPIMKDKIDIWGCGIDLSQFKISNSARRDKVIIYQKNIADIFCHWVDAMVRSCGFNTKIIKYGKYEKQSYLNELDDAMFMITLDLWETQGIFLTEAWAKNVPTFCFDMQYIWREEYQRDGIASSCPFLSEKTGIRWKSIDELKGILTNYHEIRDRFAPRRWVEENMTIEIAARQFLELIGIEQNEE